MSDIIYIASFDIGKKNFSFYIEKIDLKMLTKIKSIPKTKRYNKDGTTSDDFERILREIYTFGERIELCNSDLTKKESKGKYLDEDTMHNLTDLLKRYEKSWDLCSIFLIEKQMSFGKRHNTMAIKLAQHCWAYFSIMYGREKEIIDYPAYHKTQILGCEKISKKLKSGKIKYTAIDKNKRKKWCVEKALDIFSERDDFTGMSLISSARKKDDLSDVVCQLISFLVIRYL